MAEPVPAARWHGPAGMGCRASTPPAATSRGDPPAQGASRTARAGRPSRAPLPDRQLGGMTRTAHPVKFLKTILFLVFLACAASASGAQPLACSIEPDRLAEVGSPSIGVIESL